MTAQRITLLSVLFFLALACIFFITRDACLTPTKMTGYDASVFATFGAAWQDGLLPYKDLFDHKGPVIFFMSLLGYWLGGDFYGIVYVEIINLFLFAALFLAVNRNNAIIYFFFFLFIYWIFISKNLEGGNATEEYALFFNGLAAFAWLKRAQWRFFLYGLAGALLVFMKMNLAALSLSIFLVDLWYSKNFTKYILQASLGFMIPAGIMILYFYSHDALYEFYWSYIVCNMSYIGGEVTSRLRPYALLVGKNGVFFLGCLLMLMVIYRKNKSSFPGAVIFLVVPYLFSCISGRSYAHYILAVTPSAFILFSMIFAEKHTDRRILAFFSHRVGTQGKRLLLVCLSILAILAGVQTAVFALQRFDMTQLQSLRASFRAVGLHPGKTVLNLGGTLFSSIYPLSQTHPPHKEFFPLARTVTAPMRQLLKNQKTICPEEKYDFLLLTEHQQLSPSCPYVPVTTEFKLGKLYKFSPPSSPPTAVRQE